MLQQIVRGRCSRRVAMAGSSTSFAAAVTGSGQSFSTSGAQVTTRVPELADGSKMYQIVVDGTLDTNSPYMYLLFSDHFKNTSIVAEGVEGIDIAGFVAGYRPPERPDALFVWQVGTDARARGRGVAGTMLYDLAKRLAPEGVKYMHATVTPTNAASQNLFRGFARKVGADVKVVPSYYDAAVFPKVDPAHESEDYYEIGPFDL